MIASLKRVHHAARDKIVDRECAKLEERQARAKKARALKR